MSESFSAGTTAPDSFAALVDQARHLVAAGDSEKAHRVLIEVLPKAWDSPGALQRLGVAMREVGDLENAATAFRRALDLDPESVQIRNNLAVVLQDCGDAEQACDLFRRNADARPRDPLLLTNYLGSAQYVPAISARALFELHRLWADRIRAPARLEIQGKHARERDRRLTLGFVSSDFAAHPVTFFMLPLFRGLDRAQCRVVAIACSQRKDALTGEFRRVVDQWLDIAHLSDRDAARLIADAGVDILFDMSGHSLGNRLGAFAFKPAPIQISWAGYVGTTGVPEIDYVLADAGQAPFSEDEFYSERVLRVPRCYVPYEPPSYAPDVAHLPAAANGFVTFGSFNNPAKLNRQVIELWAQILATLPKSRLSLRYRGVDAPINRRRIISALATADVEPDRISFAGLSAHRDMLGAYNRIDIALDPFPYSGGVTTLEALWMGVPVVTLTGETFAGRHSTSYLANLGLHQLIAKTRDEYVSVAAPLATDRPRLQGLRAGLRDRMRASPMLDHAAYARAFMTAIRQVWDEFCISSPAADRFLIRVKSGRRARRSLKGDLEGIEFLRKWR